MEEKHEKDLKKMKEKHKSIWKSEGQTWKKIKKMKDKQKQRFEKNGGKNWRMKKVGTKIREKDQKKCRSRASWASSQGGSSLGATFQSLREKSENHST